MQLSCCIASLAGHSHYVINQACLKIGYRPIFMRNHHCQSLSPKFDSDDHSRLPQQRSDDQQPRRAIWIPSMTMATVPQMSVGRSPCALLPSFSTCRFIRTPVVSHTSSWRRFPRSKWSLEYCRKGNIRGCSIATLEITFD